MKVYSLTQVCREVEIGCYGVFSTPEKATEYAIEFAKSNGQEYTDEDAWNGFTKDVHCGDYLFEIWEHRLDETD